MIMAFPLKEILEFNKFSHLHDGDRIFFCKFEFIEDSWNAIRQKDHDCILISGNSDYGHKKSLLEHASKPPNLKHWFCVNKSEETDGCTALPLGIENFTPCKLGERHGFVWGHAPEKHRLISEAQHRSPTKMIYANFEVHKSRHPSREMWRHLSQGCSHITWQPNNTLSYARYLDEILDHEAVLCPQGNVGVEEGDNHRIYETLYAGRIPVTHAQKYHKMLHHKFPIIVVEDLEAVADKEFMRSEIDRVKSTTFDPKYLKFSHWKNTILEAKKRLK